MAKKESQKESDQKVKRFGSPEELMAAVSQKFGDGSLMMVGSQPALNVDVIKTGAPTLDMALGVGGIPKGRIVEIYGPESSGKTTLALSVVRECQKAGGVAAFVDAEHALDPDWARKIGVDIDKLMISQPNSGDQALEITEMLASSTQVDLVVVDSVAALIPQAEIDGEMGESHIGLQARLMSQAMRKLVGATSKTKCTIIFINQIRLKIGVMFGNPETTPGGNALKFYSSVRLDIRRKGGIKQGEDNIGNQVEVKVIKNKVAPPFKKAEFNIYFGADGVSGVDYISSLLSAAINNGVVTKNGSWINFGDTRLGLGNEAAVKTLRDTPELSAEIETKLREARAVLDVEPDFDEEQTEESSDGSSTV